MQHVNGANNANNTHEGRMISLIKYFLNLFMVPVFLSLVLGLFGCPADPCAICFYRQVRKLPSVAQLLRRRHS